MMGIVELEIEPPEPVVEDDDGDISSTYVYVSITEVDGTGKQASISIPGNALTDSRLTDEG